MCWERCSEILKGLGAFDRILDGFQNAKNDIKEVQESLQSNGQIVQLYYKRLETPTQKLKNIESSLKVVQDMKYAVALLNKAQQQIVNLRHLTALRTIKKVQELPILKTSSGSTRLILSFIPKLTEMVERQVEESLSDMLVSSRRTAETLGKQLMAQAESKVKYEKKKNAKEKLFQSKSSRRSDIMSTIQSKSISRPSFKPSRELNSFMLSRLSSIRQSYRLTTMKTALSKEEIDFSHINFSQLFTYENIFIELGKGKEFREKMKSSRRSQILLSSTLYNTPQDKFEALLGQLTLEKELWQNDERLRSEEELQSLWVETLCQLDRTSQEMLTNAKSVSEALEIKHCIECFIYAIQKQGYKHRTYQLHELLRSNHWRFNEILIHNFQEDAIQILANDSYTPLSTEAPQAQSLEYLCLKDAVEDGFYPFSQAVPELCDKLNEYANHDMQYLDGISENVGDELFRTIDKMLHVLNDLIYGQVFNSSVLQTAMIAVNATHLYKALASIYEHFEELTGCSREFSARAAFIQLKEQCEQAIFQKLHEKVDSYLKLLTDFCPAVAKRHDWFDELLYYLENTTINLEKLCGSHFSSTVLLSNFQHLSSKIISILSDKSLAKISYNFYYSLNEDIRAIERYISNSMVCGRIPGISETFSELKEIVAVIVNDELNMLLDNSMRQFKYWKINIPLLTILLEKYREVKGKKPKKSTARSVAKKLKTNSVSK